MNVLQSTYDELKAERDALAVDAARYRWLRISANVSWNVWITYENLMSTEADRADMDRAIDAAKAGERGDS